MPSAPGANWWRYTNWHSPEFRATAYVPQEGGVKDNYKIAGRVADIYVWQNLSLTK